MTKDYLIIPDTHAHPDFNNNRADWLGKLILDLKPDVVINMGDTYDMPSLSAYDKGKASFNGRNYEKDILSGNDFLDRMWHPIRKAKKKKPLSVFIEGNHEHRLKKVLEYQPELSGDKYGVSYKNYALADYHQEVVHYEGQTPGIYTSDGIIFSHYLCSGLMGRPISGEHHAHSLLTKNHTSCVVGHSHTLDYCVRPTASGKKIMGLVAGVYQDYESTWAGNTQRLWHRGVCYLRNVSEGTYDLEFIGIKGLKREYGT